MPPKAKNTDLTGFTAVDDKTVTCNVCSAAGSAKAIQKRSAPGHLAGREHGRSVEVVETRALRRRADKERRDRLIAEAVGASEGGTVQLAATHISVNPRIRSPEPDNDFFFPLDSGSVPIQPELDDSPEVAAAQERARLDAVLDSLGGMNETAMGYALGAERPETVEEREDLDDERRLQELLDGLCFDSPEEALPQTSNAWFPYTSKVMLLLNVADNIPRVRMSESQLKLWLWILKECGVKDVPSLKAFRKFQESLRKGDSGVSTKECKSPKGNLFYVNDLHKIIANDWANPHTRKHIHIYPEIPADGIVREMWHADKWRKGLDRSKLTPMWAGPDSQHYYVDELAQLKSGKLFIPIRWLKQYTTLGVVDMNMTDECAARGFVVAEGYFVRLSDDNILTVLDEAEPTRVQAASFHNCFVNLEARLNSCSWSESSTQAGFPKLMPNPKRAKAAGRPYYCGFIIFFGDDVSGNRSKSWNKHLVAEVTHANLDRELLQQTAHIHHISCSQHASVAEQFAEIQRAIAASEAVPFPVFDALTHQEACVELGIFIDASDNPMQSEISSHMGGPASFKCRECVVGGTQEEKRSDQIYHQLFFEGELRSWEGVLTTVAEHLQLACEGKKGLIEANQTDTGVKDLHAQFWIEKVLGDFKSKTDALRNAPESLGRPLSAIKAEVTAELERWVEDHYNEIINPFFLIKGHDPTQDTPVEILHTILLGIDKYIWYYSYSDWNPAKKDLFAQRLQATDAGGLSLPPIRAAYIMQYAGSLIGRQLKTVIQTAVFHLHDLVDDDHYATWRAVAQLAALLWVPEIDDVEQYCHDVQIAADNVLDTFCKVDPSKMVTKFKLHLLVHLCRHIRQLGPLVGAATENFESNNAVFRAASIHSNHQAPSRDIAHQLAGQEGVRHRILGGWWFDAETQTWVRAGEAVREYMASKKDIKSMLGWVVHDRPTPGKTRLAPLPKRVNGQPRAARPTISLRHFCPNDCLDRAGYLVQETEWHECREIVSAVGDECGVGGWVFYDQGSERCAGRIRGIFSPVSAGGPAVVVLDCFEVKSTRHMVYDMPILVRPMHGPQTRLVPAKAIQFNFNAQHSCYDGRCAPTGRRHIVQERQLTELTEAVIEHTDDDTFIINTSAFHNAHLVRRVLPDLTRPVPMFDTGAERERFHHAQAAKLRATDGKKRKQRDDAAAQKKAAAAAAQATADALAAEAREAEESQYEEEEERPTQRRRGAGGTLQTEMLVD